MYLVTHYVRLMEMSDSLSERNSSFLYLTLANHMFALGVAPDHMFALGVAPDYMFA
jgi:hypothetical protein